MRNKFALITTPLASSLLALMIVAPVSGQESTGGGQPGAGQGQGTQSGEAAVDTAPDDMGEQAPLQSTGERLITAPDSPEEGAGAGAQDAADIDTAPDDMGEEAPLESTGDPLQENTGGDAAEPTAPGATADPAATPGGVGMQDEPARATDTGPPDDTGEAEQDEPAPGTPAGGAPAPGGAQGPANESGMASTEEGATPGGGALILDIDSFSQEIYERGFRQGYLRGIADAQERLGAEMQRSQRRAESGERGGPGGDPRQQSGTGSGGTIVVLPPGVSPEAFLEELVRRNEGG